MSTSIDSYRASTLCTYPVRFFALISIAVLGTAIVIVLMSVPVVRNVITFKDTNCRVLNKTLETQKVGSSHVTRGIIKVSFVPRYDTRNLTTSCAFRTPMFNEFYKTNQSSWLDGYEIGKEYRCYYSAELKDLPTCANGKLTVAFSIPNRIVVIVMIAISGVCMLSVPIVVLVITIHRESHVDTLGNKALFTPQNPGRGSEADSLLPSRFRHAGHIQARYSTDDEKLS